jgi:hypothetical protein
MTSPALAPPVSELPPAIPLEEADDRLSRIVNNLLDCHTGPVTVLRGGRPVAFITSPRRPAIPSASVSAKASTTFPTTSTHPTTKFSNSSD